MASRILALARARLSAEWIGPHGANLPIAALLFHAAVAAALCGVARDALPPYGYVVLALSIPLFLTAIPLLGELAPLLRADPAQEWIGAMPVSALEQRAARVLCLGVVLVLLGLGSLLPAALLAPASLGLGTRLALVLCGLAQTAAVAAALLALQSVLGRRAEGLLLLFQTLVLCAAMLGTILGISLLPGLATWTAAEHGTLPYPPAWFGALALSAGGAGAALAAAATLLALALLAFAPFPPAPSARRTASPLALLLAPLRALATRVWVARDERACFDFVYDALPAERDFVTRAYPLVALPLAFLLLGARTGGVEGEGLLAILLFAPTIYLPVLLAHVPATSTPDARWLIETSPVDPDAEARGARKAVCVRFLAPLFVLLFALAWARGGFDLAARLTPPAAAVTWLALRLTWDTCVSRPPLSTPASELGSAWANDFTSLLMGLAIAATLLAVVAWRLIEGPLTGLSIAAAVAAFELGSARRSARVRENLREG